MNDVSPIITIDGPTASGKGTIASGVAGVLGFNYLDSGALYRLAALQSVRERVDPNDDAALGAMARCLPICFDTKKIQLNGEDVTDAIRTESIGNLASQIARGAGLRQGLLDLQRAFAKPPGLVADGRDMGTVVFPTARFKVFLTASAEVRAERRYKQLIEKGFSVKFVDLLQNLQERDARDSSRAFAPLVPAAGAWILDSTDKGIDDVVAGIVDRYRCAEV
ncbi:MAG: (d)CMP kinase [Burkholderiaceae bacterium]